MAEAGWLAGTDVLRLPDAAYERAGSRKLRLFAWACAQVRPDVTDVTWQAFWRTAIEGQRAKHVAADLGLSVAAVYGARSRVLARLKELIRSVQEPAEPGENNRAQTS